MRPLVALFYTVCGLASRLKLCMSTLGADHTSFDLSVHLIKKYSSKKNGTLDYLELLFCTVIMSTETSTYTSGLTG